MILPIDSGTCSSQYLNISRSETYSCVRSKSHAICKIDFVSFTISKILASLSPRSTDFCPKSRARYRSRRYPVLPPAEEYARSLAAHHSITRRRCIISVAACQVACACFVVALCSRFRRPVPSMLPNPLGTRVSEITTHFNTYVEYQGATKPIQENNRGETCN